MSRYYTITIQKWYKRKFKHIKSIWMDIEENSSKIKLNTEISQAIITWDVPYMDMSWICLEYRKFINRISGYKMAIPDCNCHLCTYIRAGMIRYYDYEDTKMAVVKKTAKRFEAAYKLALQYIKDNT